MSANRTARRALEAELSVAQSEASSALERVRRVSDRARELRWDDLGRSIAGTEDALKSAINSLGASSDALRARAVLTDLAETEDAS